MNFIYATGGREKYFKAENVGDCVTRAIANATGKDYLEIYNRLKEMAQRESVKHHRGHKKSSVRDGVFKETWKRYLKEIGWIHHSTCAIGSTERKVKLADGELPMGTLIVQISKHLTCVKDGVIYDTYNCSIKEYYDEFGDLQVNDKRCVYGYWTAPSDEELRERKEQESIAKAMKEKQEKSLAETKIRIDEIKKSYQPKLSKLEKKIKELQHQLKIETNRMNKEIAKVKKQNADALIDELLDD